MLRLADRWVWDSWTVDDDAGNHHLFFLQAPRGGHPDGRHRRASVGHAVSRDYTSWTVLPDALRPAPSPAWDDLAIWTGSVVRGDDGTWHLFYSALSRNENGAVQRIGRADSRDLVTWTRLGDGLLVEADPRWYAGAWRDPYVFRDPGGRDWHMLVTARGPGGGVLGHARSADLTTWEVLPPLTEPAGFVHLEVAHTAAVAGRWVLLFCCRAPELAESRRLRTPRAGMWSAPAESPLGPFALDRATPLEDPSLYAAHLIHRAGGEPALLGFTHPEDGEPFPGEIGPPVPVRLTEHGTLSLADLQPSGTV